jgi:putative FmdB family regulatory protein
VLYEYQCTRCRNRFEIARSVHQRNVTTKCGCGGKAVKLISASITGGTVGVNGRIGKHGAWCHSIDDDPVWIKNKHDFKEKCKARDLRPVGLE